MDNITDVATAISSAEGTIGKLVKEDKIYDKADSAMDKINVIGREFSDVGRQTNEVISENRRNIKTITTDLADTSPHLERGVKAVSDMVEENRENIKKITTDLTVTMPRVNKSLYDVNIITGQIARGEGTVGAAVMDNGFKVKVDKAIDSIGKAADELTKFASGANDLKSFLGVDIRSNILDRETQANLFLRLAPSSKKEYVIGGTFYINYEEPDPALDLEWREARFDEMTFTILLGWRFFGDKVALKIGAIESVFGGIFEYSKIHEGVKRKDGTERISLSTLRFEVRALDQDYEEPLEVIGFEKEYEKWETPIMLRLIGRHNFGNGLTIQMGAENLANTPRFMFGFVFEYMDEDIKYVAAF